MKLRKKNSNTAVSHDANVCTDSVWWLRYLRQQRRNNGNVRRSSSICPPMP